MMRVKLKVMIACLLGASLALLLSCKRETRDFRGNPAGVQSNTVSQSDLQPGSNTPPVKINNPDEQNAYALSEGKRLFDWYNCSGCHAHGGGGMGPPLMDAKWIYGEDPANIYATITEGRPNGMPSFRQKIPDAQVWQLVAFVRSLSGQVRSDVAPARDDHMRSGEAPAETTPEKPVKSGLPKSAERVP